MSQSVPGPSPAVVPVIAEDLEVGRRIVDLGGVRVTRRVEHDEVPVDVSLARESVRVDRLPIGRDLAADEQPCIRYEGDTVVVPVVEESLVVTVRRVLREEVRVTRERHVQDAHHTATLRRDRIETAPIAPDTQESTRHG